MPSCQTYEQTLAKLHSNWYVVTGRVDERTYNFHEPYFEKLLGGNCSLEIKLAPFFLCDAMTSF